MFEHTGHDASCSGRCVQDLSSTRSPKADREQYRSETESARVCVVTTSGAAVGPVADPASRTSDRHTDSVSGVVQRNATIHHFIEARVPSGFELRNSMDPPTPAVTCPWAGRGTLPSRGVWVSMGDARRARRLNADNGTEWASAYKGSVAASPSRSASLSIDVGKVRLRAILHGRA